MTRREGCPDEQFLGRTTFAPCPSGDLNCHRQFVWRWRIFCTNMLPSCCQYRTWYFTCQELELRSSGVRIALGRTPAKVKFPSWNPSKSAELFSAVQEPPVNLNH